MLTRSPRPFLPVLQQQSCSVPRAFAGCNSLNRKSEQIPPRPTLPDKDVKWEYLKGSGPGGQKINKTNSAVQMTHLPTGIVVKSQETRSQSQNYTIARRLLAEKVEVLEKGDDSRVVKKAQRAQRTKASADKKKRRKYKKLDNGKVEEVEDDDNGVDAPDDIAESNVEEKAGSALHSSRQP